MPKLKKRDIPFAKMQRLLMSYGLNGVQLGLVLGMSPNAARRRLINPWLLTLEDLDKVRQFAGVPWGEILEAIVK